MSIENAFHSFRWALAKRHAESKGRPHLQGEDYLWAEREINLMSHVDLLHGLSDYEDD